MGFKDYLPKFIREYFDDWRAERVWDKCYGLGREERYSEAAELYAEFAVERLKISKLSYCQYCIYAFEMWLKAGNSKKMLQEARNVLRVYSDDNGTWLKYNSGQKVEDLITMVVQLYGAKYQDEAEILAEEINQQLAEYKLPMRCSVAAPVRAVRSYSPSVCPQCGGKVPYAEHLRAVECSYCGTVIYRPKNP